jgi:hypothetical protein
MLKIIVVEGEKFVPDEKFISDAKEISGWVIKVLDDSPETKIFAFVQNEDSELLKIIKEQVPKIQVSLVAEESLSSGSQKNTSNIICGIICEKGEILALQVGDGFQVPVKHFSTYARIRKLAEHINDL